jgi:hypothetical protein
VFSRVSVAALLETTWTDAGLVQDARRDAGLEVHMYARVPSFKFSVKDIDAAIRLFEEKTLPQLRKLAGFKGATMLVNRETGLVRTIVYWDSREALESSFEPTKALRAQYVDEFGAELLSIDEFEVATQV